VQADQAGFFLPTSVPSNEQAVTPGHAPILRAGFVMEKSGRNLVRLSDLGGTRRYLVLTSNGTLATYPCQQAFSRGDPPVSSSAVGAWEVILLPARPLEFVLSGADQEPLRLECKSQADRELWVEVLSRSGAKVASS
jgi:hypothetical protein